MAKFINIDNKKYAVCDWENAGYMEAVYVNRSNFDTEVVAEAMRKNGFEVVKVTGNRILVDRKKLHFMGDTYTLNQCDNADIIDWANQLKPYEFTWYFERVLFKLPDNRVIASYAHDLKNYAEV